MRPWIAKSLTASLRMTGLTNLIRRQAGALGAVLMLHRVQEGKNDKFDPNGMLSVSPKFFEDLCAWLAVSDFDVIGMDDVPSRLHAADTSRPFLALTFDDGYLDNFEAALPIMERYELPFTIYPATGLMEGTATLWWCGLEWVIDVAGEIEVDLGEGLRVFRCDNAYNKCVAMTELMTFCQSVLDERGQRKFVDDLCARYGVDLKARTLEAMMTVDQLRMMSTHPLATIGAHTVNHYALGRLDENFCRREMVAGAEVVSAITGYQPRHMAYPYGNRIAACTREFDMASEAGFLTSVTTRRGALFAEHIHHLSALPRLSINGYFQSMPFTRQWVTGVPALLNNRGRKLDVA